MSGSIQEQLYGAVILVEERARLAPRNQYIVHAITSFQRLFFSISRRHRWLFKFRPLVGLAEIAAYAGLFLGFPESQLAITLATILGMLLLLALFTLLILVRQNAILEFVLGWVFSLGPLLFLPILNLNIYSDSGSPLFYVALFTTMAFFLLLFYVNGQLRRLFELLPAVLLRESPILVYPGLAVVYLGTLVAIFLDQ
jgi:hypothetical protein